MTEQVKTGVGAARRMARRWRGIAVAGVIAIMGTLALVALHRPAVQESRFAVVEQVESPAVVQTDPLMVELIRCRALPPQVDDPACRAAWEENRRRFFGERRATRVPGEPRPGYAAIPAPGSVPVTTGR